MLMALSSTAQYSDIVYPKKEITGLKTPGKYLRQASNSLIGGLLISAAGAGCLVLGAKESTSNSNNKNTGEYQGNDGQQAFTYIGVGLIVTGAILQIRGIVLIGRAGDAMEANKTALVLQPKINGASLVLNF